MRERQLDLLKRLTLVDGISGYEKEVSRVIKAEAAMLCEDIYYDQLGSIVLHKKGKTNQLKMMLSAHMDEVGFVVKSIDEKGYLRLHPIGGWWGHVLPAQLMTITNRLGEKYYGVIGAEAPHGKPADIANKVMAISELYLDLGVDNKEEVLALGIRQGDQVTPKSEFLIMNNKEYVLSKAMDDRAGVAVALEVLHQIKDETLDADLYVVGTVQEEVGLRGAKTASTLVSPDISIALDVTLNQDAPGQKGDVVLGCGAVLSIMDASVIAHTGLLAHIETICAQHQIAFVYDILPFGGTDSGAMSLSGQGSINMTLSLPARYVHSHRSMIHM